MALGFQTVDDHEKYKFDIESSIKVSTGYHISDIDSSSDPKYFGYLTDQGHWYIMEFNVLNGTARYIRGDTGYQSAWSSRLSLSYDYFHLVFPRQN